MKELEELLRQFEDIQDLSISEEMLGAYIENNLSKTELDAVAEQVSSNSQLSELFDDISNNKLDEVESANYPWDTYKGDYGYWELGLPPVLSQNDLSSDDEKKINACSDSFTDKENLYLQNAESNSSDNNLSLNNMANSSKTIIYGEAGENISDPVFIQQPDDHSCALRSQQIVLRDFGIDIPFADLEQIALDNGVYSNEGTYTYDIGKVLQIAGVGMHQTEGNTIYDLINELAQGHRVIVSVDAYELWNNKTMAQKMHNWIKDAIGLQGGNHALIVAGIEIDPNHPKNSKVILTDPGDGHLRIDYPMEQFKGAWGDSNCFMAATNDPAPYQYDVASGMEVPSSFAVQQYVNDFVVNNSYQLSPDMINIPQGYQPTFTGHLNVVGDVDYETFKSDYDLIVAKRLPTELSVKEQIENVMKLHEVQDNPQDKNVSEEKDGHQHDDEDDHQHKVDDEDERYHKDEDEDERQHKDEDEDEDEDEDIHHIEDEDIHHIDDEIKYNQDYEDEHLDYDGE